MYDELIKRLRELHPEEFGNEWDFAFACQQIMHEAADAIEELEAINEKQLLEIAVLAKERKKGKWTLNKDGSGTCSECGRVQFNCWDLDNWDNFCHFCGADMRGTVVLNPITTEEIQHVGYDDEQMGREK